LVGIDVGAAVGCAAGDGVGALVGIDVGAAVGCAAGDGVGALVGDVVGSADVGDCDGVTEGDADG
jgi:hypothetical protein